MLDTTRKALCVGKHKEGQREAAQPAAQSWLQLLGAPNVMRLSMTLRACGVDKLDASKLKACVFFFVVTLRNCSCGVFRPFLSGIRIQPDPTLCGCRQASTDRDAAAGSDGGARRVGRQTGRPPIFAAAVAESIFVILFRRTHPLKVFVSLSQGWKIGTGFGLGGGPDEFG